MTANLVAVDRRDERRRDRLEERSERLTADPRVDAEPTAGDDRTHDGREVCAEDAVSGAREDGEGEILHILRIRRIERGDVDGVAVLVIDRLELDEALDGTATGRVDG